MKIKTQLVLALLSNLDRVLKKHIWAHQQACTKKKKKKKLQEKSDISSKRTRKRVAHRELKKINLKSFGNNCPINIQKEKGRETYFGRRWNPRLMHGLWNESNCWIEMHSFWCTIGCTVFLFVNFPAFSSQTLLFGKNFREYELYMDYDMGSTATLKIIVFDDQLLMMFSFVKFPCILIPNCSLLKEF